LFARGYIGPNATDVGSVYAILASDWSASGNSLATTDTCPAYDDDSGSEQTTEWSSIYLPPIVRRLQKLITGNLKLTTSDVSNFPYLCGFETQIARERSPFCDVFSRKETLQYEYQQDLRYWYGTGPGSYNNKSVILPVIQGVVDILRSGPDTPVIEQNGEEGVLGPLTVAFTHDNQINQMVSSLGIFDVQPPLPSDQMNNSRVRISRHCGRIDY
jgi:acid phosphatase